MIKQVDKKKLMQIFTLFVGVLFLGNCKNWLGDNSNKNNTTAQPQEKASAVATQGKVLFSIDGKPVITEQTYEEYVKTLEQTQPQMAQLKDVMPDLPMQLFENMKKEQIINYWVEQNKIDELPSYQKDLKMSTDFLKTQLNLKYFQEEYPKMKDIAVSDVEARKVYEEQKKAIPQLTLSRGGINARGVMFDKKSEAQAFMDKVQQEKIKLDQAAKNKDLTIKNFETVNEYSFELDPQLKETLMGITKFPALKLVAAKDNKYWVVEALDKQEAKYVPFEEVKDAFKQQLITQKLFGEEVDKLAANLKTEENKEYFEKLRKDREAQMEKMQPKETQSKKTKNDASKKEAEGQKKKSMPKPPVKGA